MTAISTGWLAATLLIAAQPPIALEPTSKWTVNYEDTSCVLSRDFGAGAEKVTLAITPAPVGNQSEIAILAPASGRAAYLTGSATMAIGTRDVPVNYGTFISGKAKLRVTRVYLDQTDVDTMADTTAIRLPVSSNRAITLMPRGIVGALKATSACRADLRTLWGIDETTRASVDKPAKGNPAEWITEDDYPADALSANVGGDVYMLWKIGVDGRVKDCRAIRSSGVKVLDDAACKAITLRGRYTPARDAAGRPVETWATRTVKWIRPEG